MEMREVIPKPAISVWDNNCSALTLKHANGSTIERRLDRETIQPTNKMVVNLVKNTQSDVTGDIFAHHAMFPEQEHDLTNLVLGWCIRPGR